MSDLGKLRAVILVQSCALIVFGTVTGGQVFLAWPWDGADFLRATVLGLAAVGVFALMLLAALVLSAIDEARCRRRIARALIGLRFGDLSSADYLKARTWWPGECERAERLARARDGSAGL